MQIFLNSFKLKENLVEIDKKLYKKGDIPKIVADISKLRNLNWEPKISIKESVLRIKNSMLQDIEG